LTLDGLVVRDITYDHLDADLEFLIDDERDPEGISDMAYAVGGDAAEVAAAAAAAPRGNQDVALMLRVARRYSQGSSSTRLDRHCTPPVTRTNG
jgi:hypothetical protein